MVSKQEEQLFNQAQLYQQHIQNILAQKGALNLELREIKKALEDLEKTEDESVYKISGPILIKTKTESVKKELKDKEELINLKMDTIEKQEKKIRSKIEELREKITGSEKEEAGG